MAQDLAECLDCEELYEPSNRQVSNPLRSSGWPIERTCLLALFDLGLSEREIARYFRVDETEVMRRLSR